MSQPLLDDPPPPSIQFRNTIARDRSPMSAGRAGPVAAMGDVSFDSRDDHDDPRGDRRRALADRTFT